MYDLKRLNRLFAVSSLLLVLGTILMVLDEHYGLITFQRQWRDYQTEFDDLNWALADIKAMGLEYSEYRDRVNRAKQTLTSAQAAHKSAKDMLGSLNGKLEDIDAKLAGIVMNYASSDAILKVKAHHLEEEKTLLGKGEGRGPSHEVEEARHEYEKAQTERDELKLERDQLEDARKELIAQIDDLRSPLEDAQKNDQRLRKEYDDALKQRSASEQTIVKTALLNAPVLDFMAPTQTINQVRIEKVLTDLNFVNQPRTERCHTCHVAIGNAEFAPENFSRTLWSAVQLIQKETASQEPLVTAPQRPPSSDEDGEDEEEETFPLYWTAADPIGWTNNWRQIEPWQRTLLIKDLLREVNRYYRAQGRPELNYRKPLTAHPRLDLYVSDDSPHPMNHVGCTSCHGGAGQETDFVLAAHVPDHVLVDPENGEVVDDSWADRDGDEPSIVHRGLEGFEEMTGREPVTQEEWYHDHYHWSHDKLHYIGEPMRPKRLMQANCSSCHSLIDDIRDEAPLLAQGKSLFVNKGCINCHKVAEFTPSPRSDETLESPTYKQRELEQKVGPDLRHVSAKLDRDFAKKWIFYPKGFRPTTWMPQFFLQENNGWPFVGLPPMAEGLIRTYHENEFSHNESEILRTQTEVAAITEYLFAMSADWTAEPIPNEMEGDVDNGRELFGTVGCLGCHGNIDHQMEEDGPSIGQRWITADLMAQEDLDEDEALEQFEGMSREERYGYISTHMPDKLTRAAPDLSNVASKFPNLEAGLQWLYSWIREPRHYSGYTKMPKLRITPQEAIDLAEYLMTMEYAEFVDDPKVAALSGPVDESEVDRLITQLLSSQYTDAIIQRHLEEKEPLTRLLAASLRKTMGSSEAAMEWASEKPLEEVKLLYLGNKMVQHYGCYSCHEIAGFEGATRPGTELTTWSQKHVSQLAFGYFDPVYEGQLKEELFPERIGFDHESFARNKLRNPRVYDRSKDLSPYEKLKMPNFHLTNQQVEALVTFLLSRLHTPVHPDLKVPSDGPELAVAKGRALVEDLNCIGCHLIDRDFLPPGKPVGDYPEHTKAMIRQFYEVYDEDGYFDEIETRMNMLNAPPWLRGQGAKVQQAWLYEFLNNIEMLRPWLKVRMPSFYLTDEQTKAIGAYFHGLAKTSADKMTERLRPVTAELSREDDKRQSGDAQVDAGWYEANAKLIRWLVDEGVAQGMVRAGNVDVDWETLYDDTGLDPESAESLSDEEVQAEAVDLVRQMRDERFRRLVERMQFFASLYDADFPFDRGWKPSGSAERFNHGEKLLAAELKCLSCHVLGDPEAPGTSKSITAPNLALSERRLRRDWVRSWFMEPQVMQPGSAMPQWFPEAQSAFTRMDESDRNRLEATFGESGSEQMDLLLDFLFEAGRKSHTTVPPPRTPTQIENRGEDSSKESDESSEEEIGEEDEE
jgi:hypothetical protein